MIDKIPQEVLGLQYVLHVMGVQTVIAGGSIRDLCHNRAPKDYDLWIIQKGSLANCEDFYLLDRVETVCKDLSRSVQMIKSYNEVSFDGRLRGVVKCCIDYTAIDVIDMQGVAGDLPADLNEVLDSFDFSINQFGIDTDGELVVKFDFNKVLPIRKDFQSHRIERIQSKFPDYDWSEVTGEFLHA